MRTVTKLAALMVVLWLTSGCEMIQTVPSARGRVIDAASGQPISHAVVVRNCSDASKKKITDSDGEFKFHGKWRLQVALGDTIRPPRSYLIEASGYGSFETNRVTFGWANQGSERDDLGTIAIAPQ
jgi:hypothetical protein